MATGPLGTTPKKNDEALAEELDRLKERTEETENRQEARADRVEQEANIQERAELFAFAFKDGANSARADKGIKKIEAKVAAMEIQKAKEDDDRDKAIEDEHVKETA